MTVKNIRTKLKGKPFVLLNNSCQVYSHPITKLIEKFNGREHEYLKVKAQAYLEPFQTFMMEFFCKIS